MIKFLPSKITALLDVGCGEGNFAHLVKKQFGCTVYGVEPFTTAYRSANQKLDRTYNQLFDESFETDITFDAITFNDVLEHMVDPGGALRHCRESLLSPDGIIVASIPNILYFHDFGKMLLERDWKYEDAGIFDKTHLRFFTRKSIIRLFEESGFNIHRIEGIRPTDSKKFTLMNLITFGYWAESKFLQYAVVAKRAK